MMRVVRIALLSASALTAASASAAPEAALRANDFVDSVCVATHWSYPDTPYGARFAEVKQLLVASHIRHCRDGLDPKLHQLAQAGITCTVVTNTDSPSPVAGAAATSTDQIRDALKAFNAVAPPAIDSVEAPNEPDLFWFGNVNGIKTPTRTYKGQPFPAGAVAFVRDLRASLRADPATAPLPFIGIALGSTLAPGDANPLGDARELSGLVDWGNFHPYCGGNPFSPNYFFDYDSITHYYLNTNYPSNNLDWLIPIAQKPYGGTQPLAATETGYSTNAGSISLALHGKYMPRLFLEYFRRGIKRTCSYELVDEHDNLGDRESNFGLLKFDLTPKPAYLGVQSLLALLDDRDAGFTPGTLDYTMTVQPTVATVRGRTVTYDHPEFVHHLLLQKGDGRFDLVVWHEIGDADTSVTPMVELSPPPLPLTVTTPQRFLAAAIYRLDDANQVQKTTVADPAALTTQVGDRPLVIEWTPLPAAAGDGGPSTAGDAGDAGAVRATDGGDPSGASDKGCACELKETGNRRADGAAAAAPVALLLLGAVVRRRRRAIDVASLRRT